MNEVELKRCLKLIKEAQVNTRSIKEIATTFYQSGLITKKEYNDFMSK